MPRLLRHLLRFRGLLLTLTQRELKARYRGSTLGFFWSLVNPLALIVVYAFVFSTIFAPRDRFVVDYGPYGLFLACGVIPWIWLQTAWVEGTSSLTANSGLIRKAAFPAELLPIVSVLANLVHLVLALPILYAAFGVAHLLGVHVSFGWPALLAPVVMLLQLPLVAGLALGFAALHVHFKDVRDILGNLLTLLFFLTPILYTIETLRPFPPIYYAVKLNPLTPFLEGYQATLFYGRVPDLATWGMMLFVSAVVWALGAWIFDRLAETLGEAV
ncbi:MAG: ABC transporter permease [Acidobacteriota bacterium]